MATKVIMPQLGESVVEGTVSAWLKQEGDTVREYDALLEVSTDKVDTEVPAPASGTILKIYIPAGETVAAGVLLAVIGEAGEDISHIDPTQIVKHGDHEHDTNGTGSGHEPERTGTVATTKPQRQEAYTGHVTPVVARMAAEHNLDLSRIEGTGRNGRITKKDVVAFLEAGDSAVAVDIPPWEQPADGNLFKPSVEYELDTAPAKPAAPKSTQPTRATPTVQSSPAPQGTPGELMPLSNMRRAIADHMVRSKLHTSPHVTTVFEIDMGAVVAHREAHKADFAKKGVNLTFTAYFAAAAVVALQENPYLNSQWTDDGIFFHNTYHIGLAVAIDDGLIVPVIKNAQDFNLMGLARHINDLANRARNKQLKPDEIQGGTFTITNHGVSGSIVATPIINQPQVGILGIGMMEKRVKVINDAIAIRPCIYASLTFDHRVVDGATGDAFMQTFKRELENWT